MEARLAVPDGVISDLERRDEAEAECAPRPMDEDSFRAFYDRTARPLWAYLARTTGEPSQADDLLQEAYYRFFRAGSVHETESHRRNCLFRIATNLARDRARRNARARHVPIEDGGATGMPAVESPIDRVAVRTDLGRAMSRLKPLQRELLWLAYAEGLSHHEIARALGVKDTNVRSSLLRARRKLARLLRGRRG